MFDDNQTDAISEDVIRTKARRLELAIATHGDVDQRQQLTYAGTKLRGLQPGHRAPIQVEDSQWLLIDAAAGSKPPHLGDRERGAAARLARKTSPGQDQRASAHQLVQRLVGELHLPVGAGRGPVERDRERIGRPQLVERQRGAEGWVGG